MMTELYRLLSKIDSDHQNIILTVLEGENFGEKALISDSELVWLSSKNGFFSKHQSGLAQITICGIIEIDGQKVYSEVVGHEKRLIVCGAGHVGIEVVRLGVMLGCEVTVLDDRIEFAENARRAGADNIICKPFPEALQQIKGSADTYFVILTRGHKYDRICLANLLPKEHAYIGMIGSANKIAAVKQQLEQDGFSRSVLDSVYTPIGLDIAAETPFEIAIAILAEIIEVKNRKKRTDGYSREMLSAILDNVNPNDIPKPKVMTTIVSRKGSAPRGVGAKMLVLPDGRCIGTIGGGSMEAYVQRKAQEMIAGTEPQKVIIYHADMSANTAEAEGMVCGGSVDVLMEVI